MANREQLRKALLTQLGDYTDEDEQTIEKLLPLIEYWMQDAILVSEEGFKKFKRMLGREAVDRPALRQLFQRQTVFELDD